MVEKRRSKHHEHEEELKTGARPTPGQATRGARPRLGQAARGAAIRQRSKHRGDEEELQARARPRRGQATIGARPKPGQATHVAARKQERTVEISLEPTRSDLGQRTDGGVEIVTLQREHPQRRRHGHRLEKETLRIVRSRKAAKGP